MEASPDAPRRTRAALAEIPARLDRLRVTPLRPLTNTREVSPSLPPGYLSPAPSPDEFLIQQRGRKRLPTTWSPDIDIKRNSTFHSAVRTPPKNTPGRSSPPKLGVTLRSTPRKRLLLGDIERVPLTPEKIDFSDISTPQKFKINSPIKGTPPIKRCRLDRTFDGDFKGPLDTALKGLSPTQLIHMIKRITHKHPEVEQEIRKDMPAPDMAPLEEKLSYLKSNIFKSLPTSRLTSKTDSPAYSRVATHITAFKKCLVEQGKVLVESQHWESVMNYVFLAWSYVRATPVWDNQPHNTQRKQCFKALTNFCMTALKKGGFGKVFYMDVQEKLQGMEADSEEVQSCLKYVNGQLQDY
ncbi:tethering factor for nuclear proteasome sts1 [Pararge aegeria]|uniref:Jg22588 protein n=2 Tax=Pararge aegeria TaxID=116150 RepID=A0A8S4SNY4_9NEOP|nr:tethering factor for nuclear proteasome sts1 [Pararge aegeria]XP_039757173.1 tethering factor for nuclear proteasome sts1 [Pararge aegeria]CAH2267500.1 jg22588 [Pararge aegeria aegeria]